MGISVRDSCASESELTGTGHQLPDGKALVEAPFWEIPLVAKLAWADFPS